MVGDQSIVIDENEQIKVRRAKLAALREQGCAYPNDFRTDALAEELINLYADHDNEALEQNPIRVKVAGRIMTRRIMGKASFTHIKDMSGKIQLYIKRDDLPEGVYADFKTWDLGDIIGVEGILFKTKTDELTVRATDIKLLTKALRPLPDKYHGLTDHEMRYRKRYVDLIANEETKKIFLIRSKLVSSMRRLFEEHGFVEVETPMMQSMAGGALARPFITHHNALDMELYMRIAPELFLKRLVVGGFDRVFEINRNFRNEGISTRHNPEFTMIEFYWAYVDYHHLMDFTENMLRHLALDVLGSEQLTYQGMDVDFSGPFERMTVKEAILKHNPDITLEDLNDLSKAKAIASKLDISVENSWGLGKIQIEIFEKTAEHKLQQPTFITAYPAEVSPLARRNDLDPFVTDRFEFFVAGREIANGFSELNDPEDQAERFKAQVKEREAGDNEAMDYDEDYIEALEYGLPPTAGQGIGIDRLAMLFTDSPSIRDVILFPLMRK
ncbi:MAG: lysine--tRNA ligase [Gammaproteobacteria bacterium]|nr:lysine--tRNA ligase [Gammaproteobacteria bacterium]